MTDLDLSFDLLPNIRAVLLIFLAVSANFVGNTLNCSIQKLLINNAIVRHLFVMLIIYFTIDFTSKSSMNPINILRNTFIIYALFLVLTKQTIEMFVVNVLIIFVIYVFSISKQYIQQTKENGENKNGENNETLEWNEETIDNVNYYLQYLLLMTLTIGFGLYFNKEYTDHKKNFNLFLFLFGLNKCSSL
jgi:hypothetical protein